MMVLDRQQVLRLLIKPAGARQGLALGTVAVAARVVGDALMTTVEAVLHMAAQRGGATPGQGVERLALCRCQHAAIAIAKSFAVVPDHIRYFQGRPLRHWGGHACPSGWTQG